jgi:hypothetical protein
MDEEESKEREQMKLTKLDINYDPDLPPGMQGPPRISEPKPYFPYSWKINGVSVLGLKFIRKHVSNAGPKHDPYCGEVWTCNAGPLEFEYSTVICCTVALRWQSRSIFDYRAYYFRKELPWMLRKLADCLESRYNWFMENEYQEDPYGSLSDYE